MADPKRMRAVITAEGQSREALIEQTELALQRLKQNVWFCEAYTIGNAYLHLEVHEVGRGKACPAKGYRGFCEGECPEVPSFYECQLIKQREAEIDARAEAAGILVDQQLKAYFQEKGS